MWKITNGRTILLIAHKPYVLFDRTRNLAKWKSCQLWQNSNTVNCFIKNKVFLYNLKKIYLSIILIIDYGLMWYQLCVFSIKKNARTILLFERLSNILKRQIIHKRLVRKQLLINTNEIHIKWNFISSSTFKRLICLHILP